MSEQIFEKVCRECKGGPQPLTNFHKKRASRDGHMDICKAHAIAKAKAWAAAHPKEVRERAQQWAENNRERSNKIKRKWKDKTGYDRSEQARKHGRESRARLRSEAIAAMGGKCECCGLANARFICFDHIGGWGVEHRQTVHTSSLPSWLKKHHYPRGGETCPECDEIHQGIRLLCYDCNMSVAASPDGTCAHKETFEETKQKRIDAGIGETVQRNARAWRWQLREDAIVALGGECQCCYQSDHRFLSFDHVDNWGREQRRELKDAHFVRWLKKHHYPRGNEVCPECGEVHKGIRLLCFNCNNASAINDGICPHQETRIVQLAA